MTEQQGDSIPPITSDFIAGQIQKFRQANPTEDGYSREESDTEGLVRDFAYLLHGQDSERYPISESRGDDVRFWHHTTEAFIRFTEQSQKNLDRRQRDELFNHSSETAMSNALWHAAKLREAEDNGDIDPITGILNTGGYKRRTKEEFERMNRSGEDGIIINMDLDGFKSVNDTLGHPQGDIILKAFAQLLQGSVRVGDIVARPGGDEFKALLSGIEDVGLIAQRMEDFRKHATQVLTSLNGAKLPVTFSFSVAKRNPNESLEDWEKRADELMYQQKKERKLQQ